MDPQDWATNSAAAIEKAVLSHIHDGDIVVLHDMSDSSVQAALDIVDVLQEQGYTLVTVGDLAWLRGISVRGGKTYTKFPPAS